MSLAPRAAAIRGDDYQHAIGWFWASQCLNDSDIESVSIEDAGAGAFDDVVVRRRSGLPTTYWQVKTSNYGSGVVDEAWLTTPATVRGRSPLQRFHDTWRELHAAGGAFELALVTNRQYDHNDCFVGDLRDLRSEKINVERLRSATAGSNIGKARARWCNHLGIDMDELAEFLADVKWQTSEAESSWDNRCKPLMRAAGLRADGQAVAVGKTLVRGWVTQGSGPQSRDEIRRQVAEQNLLAREGSLVLAVHAVDRRPTPVQPNVEVEFVDLFDGDDSFSRRQMRDPQDWERVVAPALANAARDLDAYLTRRVHIVGSLRLPVWFAVGRALPDVRGWVLTLDQRDVEWSTAATPEPTTARILTDERTGEGSELALALALTHDPQPAVREFLAAQGEGIGHLLTFGPEGDLGQNSVPGDSWALAWVRDVRERARARAQELGARRVHLFMAVPAGVALMLGHNWNLMPATTVYEHMGTSYEPTLTLRG